MRRDIASNAGRATYLDHRQLCRKDVQPKVSFARAIYHMSKHFCACVDVCTCDRMPLLKRPAIDTDLDFSRSSA